MNFGIDTGRGSGYNLRLEDIVTLKDQAYYIWNPISGQKGSNHGD